MKDALEGSKNILKNSLIKSGAYLKNAGSEIYNTTINELKRCKTFLICEETREDLKKLFADKIPGLFEKIKSSMHTPTQDKMAISNGIRTIATRTFNAAIETTKNNARDLLIGAASLDIADEAISLYDSTIEETIQDWFPEGIEKDANKAMRKVETGEISGSKVLDETFEERTKDKDIQKKYLAKAKIANTKHEIGSDESRLEYAIEAFEKSNLPQFLKESLPFVPFQESNYSDAAKNTGTKATGTWQFIYGTGKKYGLCGKGFDHRRDFEKSTNAAVNYFEDIYARLENSKYFKNLQSKFGINGDTFLSFATMNAFNSGEYHMEIAMKFMSQKPSPDEKKLQEYFQKYGEGGLFLYMTKEYIHFYKTWQKQNGIRKGVYYFKESADYVYMIMAYKKLHYNNLGITETSIAQTDQAKDTERNHKETKDINRKKISNTEAFLIGGLSLSSAKSLIFLARNLSNLQEEIDKIAPQNRREFLIGIKDFTKKFAMRGAGASIENEIPILKTNIKLLCNYLVEKLGVEEARNLISEESQISKIKDSDKAIRTFDIDKISHVYGGTLNKERYESLINSESYVECQKMGDKAYDAYNELGDKIYIQIAYYFYNKASYLANEQKNGNPKYPPPKGGRKKVLERIKYVESALDVVGTNFSEN